MTSPTEQRRVVRRGHQPLPRRRHRRRAGRFHRDHRRQSRRCPMPGWGGWRAVTTVSTRWPARTRNSRALYRETRRIGLQDGALQARPAAPLYLTMPVWSRATIGLAYASALIVAGRYDEAAAGAHRCGRHRRRPGRPVAPVRHRRFVSPHAALARCARGDRGVPARRMPPTSADEVTRPRWRPCRASAAASLGQVQAGAGRSSTRSPPANPVLAADVALTRAGACANSATRTPRGGVSGGRRRRADAAAGPRGAGQPELPVDRHRRRHHRHPHRQVGSGHRNQPRSARRRRAGRRAAGGAGQRAGPPRRADRAGRAQRADRGVAHRDSDRPAAGRAGGRTRRAPTRTTWCWKVRPAPPRPPSRASSPKSCSGWAKSRAPTSWRSPRRTSSWGYVSQTARTHEGGLRGGPGRRAVHRRGLPAGPRARGPLVRQGRDQHAAEVHGGFPRPVRRDRRRLSHGRCGGSWPPTPVWRRGFISR